MLRTPQQGTEPSCQPFLQRTNSWAMHGKAGSCLGCPSRVLLRPSLKPHSWCTGARRGANCNGDEGLQGTMS